MRWFCVNIESWGPVVPDISSRRWCFRLKKWKWTVVQHLKLTMQYNRAEKCCDEKRYRGQEDDTAYLSIYAKSLPLTVAVRRHNRITTPKKLPAATCCSLLPSQLHSILLSSLFSPIYLQSLRLFPAAPVRLSPSPARGT